MARLLWGHIPWLKNKKKKIMATFWDSREMKGARVHGMLGVYDGWWMESDTIYGTTSNGKELVPAVQQWHIWRYLCRWFGGWDCSLVRTASTLPHWQYRWKETLHLDFSTLIFCTERRWRTRFIKIVSGAIRHTQPRLDLKFRFLLSDCDSESLFIPPGAIWRPAHEYSNAIRPKDTPCQCWFLP